MKLKLFLIISMVILAGIFVVTIPDGKTRLIFCDVGQGDGILIMQNNFQMLIDIGPENKKMSQCLEKYMPFWDKKIEAVILTHLDSDHSGGLKGIKEYYNVQNIYSSDLKKGDVIKYNTIVYEVLSPGEDWGDVNKNSVVGILNNRFLLMADVNSEVEQKLAWRKELKNIEVLKVSHHGSAEATSQELLDIVKPKEAIISVGKGNRFGHPTKVVLDRLEKLGTKIRRTDREGDIIYIW